MWPTMRFVYFHSRSCAVTKPGGENYCTFEQHGHRRMMGAFLHGGGGHLLTAKKGNSLLSKVLYLYGLNKTKQLGWYINYAGTELAWKRNHF